MEYRVTLYPRDPAAFFELYETYLYQHGAESVALEDYAIPLGVRRPSLHIAAVIVIVIGSHDLNRLIKFVSMLHYDLLSYEISPDERLEQ